MLIWCLRYTTHHLSWTWINSKFMVWISFLYAVTDESTIHRFFARFDERFFQFCDKELSKINTFFYGRLVLTSLNRNKVIDYKNILFCTPWYLIRINKEMSYIHHLFLNYFWTEKISEANRKYASLKADLEAYNEHTNKSAHLGGLRNRRQSRMVGLFKDKEKQGLSHTRKHNDLKLAFSEFYLSLILLQNYQNLNFTGFRKILKKHDKVCWLWKWPSPMLHNYLHLKPPVHFIRFVQ